MEESQQNNNNNNNNKGVTEKKQESKVFEQKKPVITFDERYTKALENKYEMVNLYLFYCSKVIARKSKNKELITNILACMSNVMMQIYHWYKRGHINSKRKLDYLLKLKIKEFKFFNEIDKEEEQGNDNLSVLVYISKFISESQETYGILPELNRDERIDFESFSFDKLEEEFQEEN